MEKIISSLLNIKDQLEQSLQRFNVLQQHLNDLRDSHNKMHNVFQQHMNEFENEFEQGFVNLENQIYALQEEEKCAATLEEKEDMNKWKSNFQERFDQLEDRICEMQEEDALAVEEKSKEERAARSIPDGEIIKCELNIPRGDVHRDRGHHQAIYVGIFADIAQISRSGLWIFDPGVWRSLPVATAMLDLQGLKESAFTGCLKEMRWRVGRRFQMPTVEAKVFYFPQGHAETASGWNPVGVNFAFENGGFSAFLRDCSPSFSLLLFLRISVMPILILMTRKLLVMPTATILIIVDGGANVGSCQGSSSKPTKLMQWRNSHWRVQNFVGHPQTINNGSNFKIIPILLQASMPPSDRGEGVLAMAYLEIKKAEKDCTVTLSLDDPYINAYSPRSIGIFLHAYTCLDGHGRVKEFNTVGKKTHNAFLVFNKASPVSLEIGLEFPIDRMVEMGMIKMAMENLYKPDSGNGRLLVMLLVNLTKLDAGIASLLQIEDERHGLYFMKLVRSFCRTSSESSDDSFEHFGSILVKISKLEARSNLLLDPKQGLQKQIIKNHAFPSRWINEDLGETNFLLVKENHCVDSHALETCISSLNSLQKQDMDSAGKGYSSFHNEEDYNEEFSTFFLVSGGGKWQFRMGLQVLGDTKIAHQLLDFLPLKVIFKLFDRGREITPVRENCDGQDTIKILMNPSYEVQVASPCDYLAFIPLLPDITYSTKCHFAIFGGGSTSLEFSTELHGEFVLVHLKNMGIDDHSLKTFAFFENGDHGTPKGRIGACGLANLMGCNVKCEVAVGIKKIFVFEPSGTIVTAPCGQGASMGDGLSQFRNSVHGPLASLGLLLVIFLYVM